MKIALVHDYLIQHGGAERVLETFTEIWPEAPIFTLICDPKFINGKWQNKKIHTSFLQKIPYSTKHYQWLMPIMPLATELYNFDDFDVVISNTSAYAKGIITNPKTRHICYCHTPTRYLWNDSNEYLKSKKFPPVFNEIVVWELSRLRRWDYSAAQRVDTFLANSKNVQERIEKFYRRPSEIIYPPVDTEAFAVSPNIGNYFVAGGRIVYYKRFDLIIEVFNKLMLPLIIFGDGPDLPRLKTMANKNVTFVGRISDKHRADLYQKALAYIHPQDEDFGITAVESMASGRPVIAYRKGGAIETVVENLSGLFFDEQTVDSLETAIKKFKPENFNPNDIRKYSKKFDSEEFKKNIKRIVENP